MPQTFHRRLVVRDGSCVAEVNTLHACTSDARFRTVALFRASRPSRDWNAPTPANEHLSFRFFIRPVNRGRPLLWRTDGEGTWECRQSTSHWSRRRCIKSASIIAEATAATLRHQRIRHEPMRLGLLVHQPPTHRHTLNDAVCADNILSFT